MMRHFLTRFLTRWVVSFLGLAVAAGIFNSHIHLGDEATSYWHVALIAGFLLAIVNMFLKPLLVVLSIPALLLSLGLFMVVINGFLVWLVSRIYTEIQFNTFGWAVVTGVIIGLVNFLVTKVLEDI